MSDSGHQMGECSHGHDRGRCRYCAEIRQARIDTWREAEQLLLAFAEAQTLVESAQISESLVPATVYRATAVAAVRANIRRAAQLCGARGRSL